MVLISANLHVFILF